MLDITIGTDMQDTTITGSDLFAGYSPKHLGPGAKRAAARLAATAKAETARLADVTEPDMPSRQVMRRTMRKAVKRRLAGEKRAAQRQFAANQRAAINEIAARRNAGTH